MSNNMKNSKLKTLLNLFLTFFKVGAFTFGGGYGMIALLEAELVGKKNWIDEDEFLDIVAIAESTPGPIAVNAATYIGSKIAGLAGSAVATLAICVPSFFIIYVISLFLDRFLGLEYVRYAFEGIRVGVVFLIFSAGLKMLKEMKKNAFNIAVAVAVAAAMTAVSLFSVSFSSIFYILICGALGVAVYLIGRCRERGGKK